MKEFVLPELGENITNASVLSVLVQEGTAVEKDQPVLEIETDKATIEVPSTHTGIVRNVVIKPGDKVAVGQVVFMIEEGAGAVAPAETSAAAPAQPQEEKPVPAGLPPATVPVKTAVGGLVEFVVPGLGENIQKASVLKVCVAEGDAVAVDQTLLEIETDKATIEIPSDIDGVVKHSFVKEGQVVEVGQVVFKIETAVSESAPAPVAEAPAPVQTTQPAVQKVVASPGPVVQNTAYLGIERQPQALDNPAPAAPSVRRLARELGVDINKVPGSGPGGRISIDDVKLYVKKLNLEVQSAGVKGVGVAQQPLPDFTKFGPVERKAMSMIREKTATHLSYAWATIPHVTQFDKADITELEAFRKRYSSFVEKKGAKLTVTAVLIKVIAAALKEFPQFNTSVDMDKKEVIYKDYFNIGIAVDTEHGLIVPVLKGIDSKSISDICVELNSISEKARSRKIALEDLQGGCFTISNLGGIGGTYFTPIVNSPEVAILGVSRGAMEPVYKNGAFEPRLMLPLSLSYDHRIIDGADAIRFLRYVINALENPFLLAL